MHVVPILVRFRARIRCVPCTKTKLMILTGIGTTRTARRDGVDAWAPTSYKPFWGLSVWKGPKARQRECSSKAAIEASLPLDAKLSTIPYVYGRPPGPDPDHTQPLRGP